MHYVKVFYAVLIVVKCLSISGADLSDADLRGADFSLANVTKVRPANNQCFTCHNSFITMNEHSVYIVFIYVVFTGEFDKRKLGRSTCYREHVFQRIDHNRRRYSFIWLYHCI